MILALSNWGAHTSATEGEGSCEKFGDSCPFMGKMPGLVKISLGGYPDEPEIDTEDGICKKYCCFF